MPNFSLPDSVFLSAAEQFPTPFYLYDEKGLRENARALNAAFSWAPDFREYFAVKALPNPHILKIFREEGCGVDCSSECELLLAEMSGFSGEDGIIVLAATNRPDTLDPALLREGRFDRCIEVGLPDQDQRLQILRVHARKKPLHEAVSLESWAGQTALFSGAQLEALLNEAAIRAARRGSGPILEADMESAFCGVTVGEESPGL